MASTHQPLISVIMPAYNAQKTIGASISGVLCQTYPNVELIVVDDGSTDRTAAIIAGYGDMIRCFHQENAGVSAARNHALREANGELIALCDADDELSPTYLETMERTWREAGAARRFVTSNALIYTASGASHGRELVGSKFPARSRHRMAILQRNFVSIFSLFPIDMARELDGFAEELYSSEDWDFWLRAIFSGWEVHYQRKPLALYRWTEGSKSTRSAEVAAAADELLRRAAQMPEVTNAEREYLAMRLQNDGPTALLARASDAVREGRYADARRDFLLVSRLNFADRRMATRSWAAAYIPGLLPLWRLRLRRIDDALARSVGGGR